MSGATLDAGALIALDRDDRRVVALLARAEELRATITVPATALAQAMRDPAKQARLSRLVRQPTTRLAALDGGGRISSETERWLGGRARRTHVLRARPTTPARRYRAKDGHLPLDGPDATRVGLLLARTRTRDIVDAHVVVCARRASQPVITSDPRDLSRLDPSLRMIVI